VRVVELQVKGRGYIPDHADIVRPHVSLLLGARYGSATPDAVDLEPLAPAVMSQGSTSACTGHGTSVAIAIATKGALPFVASPRGIYGVARAVDRQSPIDGMTDSGAMPDQVIRGLSAWGVRPIAAPTSDGRYSDCEPANVNDEPTLGEIESSSHALVVGSHAITAGGTARTTEIREALAAGYPVCCGTFADAAFDNWRAGDAPMGVPDTSDPNGGGHWICIVGYVTASDGSTTWKVRNSWSSAWGDSGNFYASEAWTDQVTDLYVFHVQIEGVS